MTIDHAVGQVCHLLTIRYWGSPVVGTGIKLASRARDSIGKTWDNAGNSAYAVKRCEADTAMLSCVKYSAIVITTTASDTV